MFFEAIAIQTVFLDQDSTLSSTHVMARVSLGHTMAMHGLWPDGRGRETLEFDRY